MNEVDRLHEQIAQIQENCEHEFSTTKEPALIESLVLGVFVGKLEGPAKVSSSPAEFSLFCSKCSEEKRTNIRATCPKCLSSMGGAECLGAGSREKYFGQNHLFYSAAVARCQGEECLFEVASDQWDL